MRLSLLFCEINKAGVNSHYESEYLIGVDTVSKSGSMGSRGLRATTQHLNSVSISNLRLRCTDTVINMKLLDSNG